MYAILLTQTPSLWKKKMAHWGGFRVSVRYNSRKVLISYLGETWEAEAKDHEFETSLGHKIRPWLRSKQHIESPCMLNHRLEVSVKVCDSFTNQSGLILYTVQWLYQQLPQSEQLTDFCQTYELGHGVCTPTLSKAPPDSSIFRHAGPAHKETEWRANPVFDFCFQAWSHKELTDCPLPNPILYIKVHAICFEYKSNDDTLFIYDA